MILIIYGKDKELFFSDENSVPDAIIGLYEYTKGGLDEDLFVKAIDGMVKTASIDDMVRMFDTLATDKPIHAVYTGVTKYWKAESGDTP